MTAQAYPQPEASDPDSVVDALDTGLLHWVKGETTDAVKCLRQAREAADEAGLDHRALELARASAELMPPVNATPATSSAASEADPAEPRRSRLPEPPAPSKKYANAPAGEAATANTTPTSKSTAPRGALSPVAHKASVSPPATSTTPASGRPAPPSTRPSAGPAAFASGRAEPAKTEISRIAPAKLPNGADGSPPVGGVHRAEPEPRGSTHADALDRRLTALRVRIDRVDPDGTVRVKLLDLAATASGEDNALLIVSQGVWQECKRSV